MATLREILKGVITEVKQAELKPEEKKYLFDNVMNAICKRVEEKTGFECDNPYDQKGTTSNRKMTIQNNNKTKLTVYIDVKLTQSHTKGGFSYKVTYYKVKDIILEEYENEYNRTVEEIFAEIEQKQNEMLQKKANRLPEVIAEFNTFITDIQAKMNNSEPVEGWRIDSNFKELIRKYNDSLEASKAV